MDSFCVYARCRPLNQSEITYGAGRKSVRIIDKNTVSLHDNSTKQHIFQLNGIYDQSAQNIHIFNQAIVPLINNVLNGINSTALAYGITGAGKSFTMFGKTGQAYDNAECTQYLGIIPLTFQYLLQMKAQNIITLRVSYIEIYNQQVFDLLQENQQNLQLSQDVAQGCVIVQDMTQIQLNSLQEIQQIITIGNARRVIAQTKANQVSSRSHAIVIINVQTQLQDSDQCYSAKLSLVDLAGSEKQSVHQETRGIRTFQGSNINRSLLTLGNCINMLSKSNGLQQQFIPYRDSKLTRLLKDSLGGNTKTVMIACISPSYLSYEQTANTLKYACRANKIQKVVHQNIKDNKTPQQYKKQISNLRKQNQILKMNLDMSLTMPGINLALAQQETKIKKDRVNRLLQDLINTVQAKVRGQQQYGNQNSAQEVQKMSEMEVKIKQLILSQFDMVQDTIKNSSQGRDKSRKYSYNQSENKLNRRADSNMTKNQLFGKKCNQKANQSNSVSTLNKFNQQKDNLARLMKEQARQTKQNKIKNATQYKISLKQQLKMCEQQEKQMFAHLNGNSSHRGQLKARTQSINNHSFVNLQSLRKKIMQDKKELQKFRQQISKGCLQEQQIMNKAIELLRLQSSSALRLSQQQKQELINISKGKKVHSEQEKKIFANISGKKQRKEDQSRSMLNLLQISKINSNRNRHMHSLNKIIQMAKTKANPIHYSSQVIDRQSIEGKINFNSIIENYTDDQQDEAYQNSSNIQEDANIYATYSDQGPQQRQECNRDYYNQVYYSKYADLGQTQEFF